MSTTGTEPLHELRQRHPKADLRYRRILAHWAGPAPVTECDPISGPACCLPAMRAAGGVDPWLPPPVLAVLVRVLDQRRGCHLLVLEQVRRLDLNGFGLAPCGKDHRFVLEHLLIDVERCAEQRAERRQGAQLDAWKVPSQLLFGGKPDMGVAYRCLDEVHVEATGCRDRHQGIAARDAHRDRLENLAGIDAERPGLGDRGVGLLVRDGLERDTVGLEMLRYLRHHPAPHLAGEPIITRIRPRGPWQLPACRGGRGRMIAGSLRPSRPGRDTTPRGRLTCPAVRAPGVIAALTSMTAPRRGKTCSCGTWSCAGTLITRVTD